MERVSQLAAHFKVPALVCVNKFDLNPDQTRAIEDFSKQKGMRIVGRIPFDPVFTKSMVQAKTVLEYDEKSEAARSVKKLWEGVAEVLGV